MADPVDPLLNSQHPIQLSTATVPIEQALARGWPVERISVHLGVDPDAVLEVQAAMDALILDDELRYTAELEAERRIVADNAAQHAARASLADELGAVGPGCGTHSGYVLHQRRWQPIDPLCRLAERAYQRERKRVTRAARRLRGGAA